MACNQSELQEPSIDTDKLSYEIFSILETKFLFGYEDPSLWFPNPMRQPNAGGGNRRGKVCILSIDGAGMRGVVPGKALSYLENSLKKKSGNPDARIADFFDVAAGSGVGGIFTAMLFASKDHRHPIFNADDTWKFLAEHGKKFYRRHSCSGRFLKRVFTRGCTGSGSGCMSGSTELASLCLEKSMKESFTENERELTLKDTLKPVLIPCYDLASAAPFLFSRADALKADSFDFKLWEVCRATTAEPGVFEPVVMQSMDSRTRCVAVDGGLAMSNPTAAMITHVLHNKEEFPQVRRLEDLLVLSLGTGQLVEVRYEVNEVKKWRAKEWARPMARISGDGSAELVDHAVAMAFGQSRTSNYVRIQAHGSSMGRWGASVDKDSSPENVKMLIGTAEEMLKQKNIESVLFGGKKIGELTNCEKLDWFAEELVLEHQSRSSRTTPTVAFKEVMPKTN